MRWITFIVAAFATLVLEKSLLDALSIASLGSIRPSLMGALVVFITLFASRQTALWSAWICGVLMDLTFYMPYAGGTIAYLIGPHALGYVFGCYLVLQLRAVVLRRRVLTLAAMTALALLASGIITAAILMIRSWYPQSVLAASAPTGLQQLLRHVGIALYSGLLALPFGFLLMSTLPLWSFEHSTARAAAYR